MPDDRINLESLELYLDGQMTEPMRAQFEDQIARDPLLRSLVDAQRDIDRSLRRAFAVTGSGEAVLAQLIRPVHAGNGQAIHDARPVTPHRQASRLVRPRLAIAAAIVFLVCGPFALYFAWDAMHQPTYQPIVAHAQPVRALDVAYHQEVEDGFNCDWQCKQNTEFAAYYAAGFGQPLMLKDPPGEILSIGLKYTGGITPNTLSYMAKVNDRPVMVFADKTDADPGQSLSDPNLHLFKRTIGPIVLYEVTPLNEPKLLNLFYRP
jgi:hypothetical protein